MVVTTGQMCISVASAIGPWKASALALCFKSLVRASGTSDMGQQTKVATQPGLALSMTHASTTAPHTGQRRDHGEEPDLCAMTHCSAHRCWQPHRGRGGFLLLLLLGVFRGHSPHGRRGCRRICSVAAG